LATLKLLAWEAEEYLKERSSE